jgi:hypothetical protein
MQLYTPLHSSYMLLRYPTHKQQIETPESAVSTVPTGVRSPAEAMEFSSSLCVQTSSEAHTASYPMDIAGSFPGGKARPGRDADPHLVPR